MTARQKPAPVGSFSWVANERALIRQHEEQDVEDFAFSARNDLEWLNEHMADIFERNQVDMVELLKTPGRLRGKTPGTARKRAPPPVQGHEPVVTIFDIKHPAAVVGSSDNPFYNAIAQLPTIKKLSPARKPSKSPTRSIRVLQDIQPKQLPDPMKDSAVDLSRVEGSQPATQPVTQPSQMDSQISVGDSGIWSASSIIDLHQAQESGVTSQRKSILSENLNFAPSGPGRDSAYRTFAEDSSDPPQRLPAQKEDLVQSSSPAPPLPNSRNFELLTGEPEESKKLETIEQPEMKSGNFADEMKASERSETIEKSVASFKKAAPSPRRSGRLAERSFSPLPASPQLPLERANDVVPPSSPPVLSRQEIPAVDEEDAPTLPTLPTVRSPSPPQVLAGSVRPETPTRSAGSATESLIKSPAQTPQCSPSKSSSEPPSPDAPVIRRSILNFAALPAREPLTTKKKSLEMKTARDSHVEQVRLNGASRASWMNRKGNGKSLGASSRQVEKQDEDTGEGQARKPEVPLTRKRKSESVRDDSQKRSKGSTDGPNKNIGEMEDMEEASSGETSEAMALHNKAYTQRLQDKIQRLGKPREARSFPSSAPQDAGPGYPELPQADQEVHPVPKRTKSDPQGQLPHTANTARWKNQPDEEEWIPMKQESKHPLNRSNTVGTTELKQKEIEDVRPQSPHRWNNSPKPTIFPAPITARSAATSENVPAFSLKSPTYPPKRHLPGSPLKSSFSDDWIKTPASPTRPPGEGAISAVKAHTTSVFKKAKQMLLNSSVSSASAKIETMTPSLRSWHGGNNLRQQMVSDSGSSRPHESLKQHDQLYPDLGSVVDTKAEMLASAENSASSKTLTERPVVVEHIVEPTREGRTRSSRSRNTGDVAPGVEESAPKIQKKSKADEKAEREAGRAALREREEKLREAEEQLRIAKEEQREEELQQVKEQQRKQEEGRARKEKEEQVRREKEESRRRQEERLKQEKEELRRRQQEELRRQQEDVRKMNETPSNFRDDEDYDISDRDEGSASESIRGRISSSAEPERPPSRLQKGGPRFQRTGDTNKPLRPGTADKNLPKPKPVSISVGTASQREMQSQRSKPNILTSSTLVAALKQSFEPPGLQASSSQISLSSSVSANSLRVSNPTGSKQLKSLAAAASQLKKEQEDKERKAVAKREIERRRVENQRKLEEEVRKARQKQAPTSTQKTLSRTQTVANLRQTSEEPERKMDFKSVNSKPTIVKTAVKRGFQPETTEDQQQYRQAPTKPGAPVYQQEGAKKRRTGEYDERPYEMAPPIRQSVAKKEIIPKSAMPYLSSQASSSSAGPSMLRPPTKPGAPMPQVEGVKFSKEKIRFANETAGPSLFKTPGAKSASKLAMLKTPAGVKDSPIYQNGEHIELPDIPTDSEDEDDKDFKESFNVPQWAESPELRALLRQQQAVNPEEIFGPMAKLDMDAIFQNRTDKQAHKFRARTSSANWSGADRLTAAEIAADNEARQKMIAQGGWKYQPPS